MISFHKNMEELSLVALTSLRYHQLHSLISNIIKMLFLFFSFDILTVVRIDGKILLIYKITTDTL